MTEPSIIKKDSNGNVIYRSWEYHSTEQWYDSKGNKIHRKSIIHGEVREYRWKYDENNNLIYESPYSGIECWYEYDSNGNKTYSRNSMGFETYYHFNGSIVHDKFPDGSEYWYDSDGHKFQEKDVDGVYYHFDSKGNKIQLNQNTHLCHFSNWHISSPQKAPIGAMMNKSKPTQTE